MANENIPTKKILIILTNVFCLFSNDIVNNVVHNKVCAKTWFTKFKIGLAVLIFFVNCETTNKLKIIAPIKISVKYA